ncbi:hypothetical protein BDB01DRAFT_717149 [Pilobolus umbonatus]|nr:hypothetical protein BDB01DRAFT_717149 [Pilobolus umbonatus]
MGSEYHLLSAIPPSSCQSRDRSQSIHSEYHMSAVSERLKELEAADTTGFLQYMDDQVHDTWDSAKAVVIGAQRLLLYHELPKEWQENEYVLSG